MRAEGPVWTKEPGKDKRMRGGREDQVRMKRPGKVKAKDQVG